MRNIVQTKKERTRLFDVVALMFVVVKKELMRDPGFRAPSCTACRTLAQCPWTSHPSQRPNRKSTTRCGGRSDPSSAICARLPGRVTPLRPNDRRINPILVREHGGLLDQVPGSLDVAGLGGALADRKADHVTAAHARLGEVEAAAVVQSVQQALAKAMDPANRATNLTARASSRAQCSVAFIASTSSTMLTAARCSA
jgi:hypothetical protein